MKRRRILASMNGVAFLAMVAVNFLANAIPFNGVTTGGVSDAHPNGFTPAGLTFAIWGLIYTLLLIYVIVQLASTWSVSPLMPTVVEYIGPWFIFSCLLNMIWLWCFHYNYMGLALGVIVLLLLVLIRLYHRLEIGKFHPNKKNVYFIDVAFSIYLAWISVATIAQVTIFLGTLGFDGFGLDSKIWTLAMVLVATILALLMMGLCKDIYFALVILWAIFGIYFRYVSQGPDDWFIYALIGVMVILALSVLSRILHKDVY